MTKMFLIGGRDEDGNARVASIDNLGRLIIEADVGAVTVDNVTIADPVDPARQLEVNEDGSINTQVTGSSAEDYESLTVDDTAGGFTYSGSAIKAIITCEDAQVRFRTDGTSPTASEGHILNEEDTLILDSNEDILAFEAIRTGATSGVLKATFLEVP